MSIDTTMKYQSSTVASESDSEIDLSYTQGTPLSYGQDSVDEVSSDSSSSGLLEITVEDGANWDPSVEEGNSSTITLLESNGDLIIRAPYPASSGSEEWLVSNGDAPPVKLKVVVLRR